MSRIFFSKTVLVSVAACLLAAGCARAPRQTLAPPAPIVRQAPVSYGAPLTHVVRRGETLYRIAKNYRVEVSDLMRLNAIRDVDQLEVGQKILISGGRPMLEPMRPSTGRPVTLDEARRITHIPRAAVWQTITVHHSATEHGSAQNFDRDHRRRRMGGLFYHFVIGNGSSTRDGQIEVGWRWKKQVKANRPYDIQICLVGNFSKHSVSEAQFESLANLIAALQEDTGVSIARIRRHCDIPGKHTECPGKLFPFQRLLSRVSDQRSR